MQTRNLYNSPFLVRDYPEPEMGCLRFGLMRERSGGVEYVNSSPSCRYGSNGDLTPYFFCGLEDHDPLIRERTLPGMVENWSSFLETTDEEQERMIQKRTKIGRPLGAEKSVLQLEALTGRELKMKASRRPRIERK